MGFLHTWLGTTSDVRELAANWDLLSVPGTGDPVLFIQPNNNPCRVTADWTHGGVTMDSSYSSKLDLNGFNVTGDDGVDFIAQANPGELDMGSGTLSLTNGTFNYLGIGTLTKGSSTVVFSGTSCDWIAQSVKVLNNVTISSGTTTTVPAASGIPQLLGTLTVDGTLLVTSGESVYVNNGQFVTGEDSRLGGDGLFLMLGVGAGKGYTSRGANTTIDIASFQMRPTTTSPTLAPGEYQSSVTIYNSAATAGLLEFSPGSYTFANDIKVQNTNAGGSLTIDLDTNGPDIDYQGDRIWDEQAGTITLIDGGTSTYSGLADQTIDLGGSTQTSMSISKSVGEIDFTSGDFEPGSNSSVFDFTVSGDADFDLASSDLAVADGGDVLLNTSGTFGMGSETTSVRNGDFNFETVGTLTRGSSTLVFNETCAWKAKHNVSLNHVTIAGGATVALTVAGGTQGRVVGELRITGTVNIASGDLLRPFTGCDVYLNDGAVVNGPGLFDYFNMADGHGFIAYHSGATVNARIRLQEPKTTGVLVPATYDANVLVQNAGIGPSVLTLSAGTYVFADGIELFNNTSDGVTLDNATNGPASITLGGPLTIDLSSSGNITIDDTGVGTNWIIQGDIIDQRTGGGTFLWNKGTGTNTLSGTDDVDIDLMEQDIADLVVNKLAGKVTYSGGFTTDSFVGTAGACDPNGQAIIVVGNCDWAAAFTFVSDADAMDGCSWTIGGAFTMDGQTLNATASWVLDVTGTAIAANSGSIAHCDASGGTLVRAIKWANGGNNQNVLLGSPAYNQLQEALAG